MKKKYKKVWNWLISIVVLLVSVAAGGMFTSGMTAEFSILKWVPTIIHPVIGWIIILGSIVVFVVKIYKAVV